MSGALQGIRVIDLTQGLCGPYATQLLADAGAQVVKVEPLSGDRARNYGPPFIGGESAVFLALNRRKRSIALDVERPEGRDVLLRLLRQADVVVEDLGPGVAERLGIGYEALAGERPGLVYCAISPFGERGPLKDQPGAELIIQAMSDYCGSLGAIGEPPERLGADVAGMNTAVFAFDAVLAALFHRGRTDEGQRLAVSQYGVLIHMRGIMWSAQTDPDDWFGFHCDSYVKPRDHGYRTKDGQVYFALRRGDEESWVSILSELGMTDVLDDPLFANGGRDAVGTGRYAHEVKGQWERAFADRTTNEVIDLVVRHGGEAVPVNDYEHLLAHPQVKAIGVVQEVEHPTAGRYRTLVPPWRIGGALPDVGTPPPLLGQHTREVLRDAGFTEAEVDGLVRARTVGARATR